MSPNKVKKIITLTKDIKLKNNTIKVYEDTLSTQLLQLNHINNEISKETRGGNNTEGQACEVQMVMEGDCIDWSLLGANSEKEDNV